MLSPRSSALQSAPPESQSAPAPSPAPSSVHQNREPLFLPGSSQLSRTPEQENAEDSHVMHDGQYDDDEFDMGDIDMANIDDLGLVELAPTQTQGSNDGPKEFHPLFED